MTVLDIARESVVTERPETSVADVVRTMQRETVSSVVIVDDDDPVGLVTDRDLAMLVLDGEFDAEGTPVSDVMPDELVTVDAEVGVYELVQLLSEKGVRRVPIVDDGELAGIISLSDVVVLLGMELQHVANAIRTAAPAYEQSATSFYD